MPWPVHPTGFLGARGDSDTYRIERSLRFNDDDAAYLSRTFGTPTDGKKCTLSLWYKRGNLGGALSSFGGSIFAANSSNFFSIAENSASGSDELMLWYGNARTLTSTAKFRDPSSWYHLVIVFDSTQATSSNRCRVYINGSEVTSWSTDARTNITLNSTITFNTASISALISGYQAGGVGQFDGYIAEYYFIDGQSLTPSFFGETDAITGRWKAKAYSGTYGTNGFYLKFADNSGTTATTLGKDSSGNGNNWTPNNFSVTAGAGNDSLVDSPTNYGADTGLGGEVRGNYPVFNSISKNSSVTISDGGLRAAFTNNRFQSVTIPIPSTGKWYAEFTPLNGSSSYSIGLGDISQNADLAYSLLSSSPAISYINNGNKNINGSVTSGGATYTTNDIIGVAVNADLNSVSFYKNNSIQFTVSGSSFSTYSGRWVFGGDASAFSEVLVFNGGQRPFAYTAPSGFKALCTQNLPQPTIQKPSKYMDALAYTGTGASNSISSLGFSPDLVWIKNRGTTTDHALYDIVRGAQAQLSSNSTASEVTSSSGLTAFDSAGFTIGTSSLVNTSGTQYIAWSWDAGSTTSTNTSGSITSTVRVNPQAGFSIVSYTGNGVSGATIGHGLGVAPKMVIAKLRNSAGFQWPVYHSGLTSASYYLWLNSTNAQALDSAYWSTTPTSSVFSVGTNANTNNNTSPYIAYCFAEIEGYSKFGSYTGNGLADGPFVWCGFRPRYALFKYTGGTSNWTILDSSRNSENVADDYLIASGNSAEATGFDAVDFVSNGIKIRYSGTSINASGGTIVFAAFAESPFKYARAR